MSRSNYNNKQLCALAFHCHEQLDYPILSWNVTFPPDRPKPRPHPPSPPLVR